MGVFAWGLARLGISTRAVAAVPGPTREQVQAILGSARPVDLTHNQIVSDLWIQPYRAPGDLDRDDGETSADRRRYRQHYRDSAIIKSAVRGKADAISCLKLTVLPADKDDARSNLAAEFVDWTINNAPRGSRGLIDAILTPAMLDGWSIAEKTLEPLTWKGRRMWGLAQLRSLDSTLLRLQLDQYRNVLAVVNLTRGLEYYSPDQVLLYAHNPLFSNPFGSSDVRAASRAANIIEDVYKLWYVALKLYGLPFMQAKAKSPTGIKALTTALAALREGGYCVTGPDDNIEVLNLAAAAATDGFERMIHTMREDTLFAIRGAPQPFMEGDGGANSHTDTDVQQDTSDAREKATALDICDVINRQLIPWLVAPNFGDIAMPRVKLGGTNWQHTQTIVSIAADAKERVGAEISAEWFHDQTGIPPPRDDADKLVTAQEKLAQQPPQPGLPSLLSGAAAEPPADAHADSTELATLAAFAAKVATFAADSPTPTSDSAQVERVVAQLVAQLIEEVVL